MPNVVHWKTLKTVTGSSNETDFAGTQTEPAAADVVTVDARAPNGLDQVTGAVVVVEMLDAGNAVVARGAGVFDLQFVWIDTPSTDPDDVGNLRATRMITDSVAKTAQVPYRPILIDFRGGGAAKFTTRMTNITLSAGATKYRVLWREL